MHFILKYRYRLIPIVAAAPLQARGTTTRLHMAISKTTPSRTHRYSIIKLPFQVKSKSSDLICQAGLRQLRKKPQGGQM
jgi:hypothetical protein